MEASAGRRSSRRWTIPLVLGLVLVAAVIVTMQALGMRSVKVEAEPWPQPENGFDVSWWNDAVARWVRGNRVDYEEVLQGTDGLNRFAAALAVNGPETTPARFPTTEDRLAFYINAYNALTLLGVVDSWPIESVQDVHGWLEPRAGFGFFYGLRFHLDGDETNLYDLENGVIRGFRDARIHAAINCASISCPPLAPFAYRGDTLDAQLDGVTRAFCSSPLHVQVDPGARRVALSAIFDWYRTDFEEHARRLGRSPTVLAFIEAFADAPVAESVREAAAEGYEVTFLEYNWGLNRL